MLLQNLGKHTIPSRNYSQLNRETVVQYIGVYSRNYILVVQYSISKFQEFFCKSFFLVSKVKTKHHWTVPWLPFSTVAFAVLEINFTTPAPSPHFMFTFNMPSSLSCGYPHLFDPPFGSYVNESNCLLLVWGASCLTYLSF